MSPVSCANPKKFLHASPFQRRKAKTTTEGIIVHPRRHPHEAAAIAFVAGVPAAVHRKNTIPFAPVKGQGSIAGLKYRNS
jgi:hypothetical protein